MDDLHKHEFKTLNVNPIKRGLHSGYHGSPGDKAFLTKACDCGKVKPIDYGSTQEMEDKKTLLEGK